jgi:hypothetical protein
MPYMIAKLTLWLPYFSYRFTENSFHTTYGCCIRCLYSVGKIRRFYSLHGNILAKINERRGWPFERKQHFDREIKRCHLLQRRKKITRTVFQIVSHALVQLFIVRHKFVVNWRLKDSTSPSLFFRAGRNAGGYMDWRVPVLHYDWWDVGYTH